MIDEALILRMLRTDAATWRRFAASGLPPGDLEDRLRALEAAWARGANEGAGSPPWPPCAICNAPEIEPFSGGATPYGRCARCGHGVLLAGAAPPAIYASASYYAEKDAGGSGYDAYAAEQKYREEKGRALLERILARAPARTMFEVGSGFGFTRRAASELGLETAGSDPNPAARDAARRLYGFETQREPPDQGAYDVVLYQFVLEHIPDPIAELGRARRLGRVVAVLVPNMDAAEARIFRAHYRSFRSDHLHVFSPRSIALAAERAGLHVVHVETLTNLDLLAPFLDAGQREDLYRTNRGPDMLAILSGGAAP